MRHYHKITLMLLLAMGSGCSHPLETNLSNVMPVTANSFQIAKTVDNPSPAYLLAEKQIINNLQKKGYVQSEDGKIYLTIALSDRAANSSISIKNNGNEEVISKARDKAFLKFCKDNAFKLSVIMQNISDGSIAYKGSATRRRCNLKEEASIKYLAGAATSNLLPYQSN